MELSIVVPIYQEEKNIPEFLRRIAPVLQGITQDYEIIFALDPSSDRSAAVILEHRRLDERIKLLVFSRRFGQPMATLAGLYYSRGKAVVVMDVDLQDPPELIAEMVAKWREGFDVVMAQRRGRQGETLVKRAVAAAGYKLIALLADVKIPPDTGDFRLMSRRVVDEVNRLKETHGFLRGMVAVVGFRQTTIPFDRPARFAGKGNYSRLLGSIRIGMNGVIGFSTGLLALSYLLGFLAVAGALLLGIIHAFASAVMMFRGAAFPMGGTTITILVLFLGGVQLISIGVLGSYIGRIYDEVKRRPKFIVDQAHGVSAEGDPRPTPHD